MAVPLSRLWFGMLTRSDFLGGGSDFGTDDSIVLQVTRNDFIDILNYAFHDTSQADQEEGRANVYSIGLSVSHIVPEEIQSLRVGITGDDAWSPEFLIVWGEREGAESIVPLGIVIDPKVTLSTDDSEGVISFTIRPVGLGGADVTIDSLLIMTVTADEIDAGTSDTLNLKITDPVGNLLVDLEFGDGNDYFSPQQGGANLYWRFLDSSFSKGRLKSDSIQLSIEGSDAWKPTSFFLFGLDKLVETEESDQGRPTVLVPLVHLSEWNLGKMSADPSEGLQTVTLPMIP